MTGSLLGSQGEGCGPQGADAGLQHMGSEWGLCHDESTSITQEKMAG